MPWAELLQMSSIDSASCEGWHRPLRGLAQLQCLLLILLADSYLTAVSSFSLFLDVSGKWSCQCPAARTYHFNPFHWSPLLSRFSSIFNVSPWLHRYTMIYAMITCNIQNSFSWARKDLLYNDWQALGQLAAPYTNPWGLARRTARSVAASLCPALPSERHLGGHGGVRIGPVVGGSARTGCACKAWWSWCLLCALFVGFSQQSSAVTLGRARQHQARCQDEGQGWLCSDLAATWLV